MLTEKELISKTIPDKEISEITSIIKKNKISKDDEVIRDYEEWYSCEGDSFQTIRTVDSIEYLFEINSDGEIHILDTLNELMIDSKDLLIELTDDCEKFFYMFSQKEQDEIIKKVEYYGELFIINRAEFFKHAHQPVFFKLNDKFDSSLYYFKINKDIKAIASVDEDPIFDSVTITLLHVFKNEDIEKNFRHVAKSFYRQFANVKQI